MTRISTPQIALVSAAVLSFTLLCAQAITPPPTAPAQAGVAANPPAQRQPHPAPVNLKALPKNISNDDLIKAMRQYQGDLGVGCEFCHAQNTTTKRLDFASDANPIKDTARYMIEMTADLNDKYLAEMPGRMYADPITCGTCHRGAKHPSIFIPAPQVREPRPAAPTTPAPAIK